LHDKLAFVSRRAGLLAAALAVVPAACGGEPPKPVVPPPDAVLSIDGEFVTMPELDQVTTFLLETLPIAGDDTAKARALEAGLLPRAIARHDFAAGYARAKEKIDAAMSMLRNHANFEDVQAQLSESPIPKTPVPISRRMIDPLLGAAVFGKPAGYVTPEPIACSYGFVIARVDMPLPEPGPHQEQVILSVIESVYDPLLTDPAWRREHSVQRMLNGEYAIYHESAIHWLPPPVRVRIREK
jgi:hypothetical protein